MQGTFVANPACGGRSSTQPGCGCLASRHSEFNATGFAVHADFNACLPRRESNPFWSVALVNEHRMDLPACAAARAPATNGMTAVALHNGLAVRLFFFFAVQRATLRVVL